MRDDQATAVVAHEPTSLEGRHVRLEPLKFDNIHQHFEWNNDPELNRLDSELPYERESFGEFKHRFEQMVFHPLPDNRDFEVYAEDGTLIGLAYASDVSRHHRHCTVGISIGNPRYRSSAYACDALELLLEYCFRTLEMHRVRAEAFEYNDLRRRLLQEAGFKLDGVERDHLYRDGTFWDKEIYSLLVDEYLETRTGRAA